RQDAGVVHECAEPRAGERPLDLLPRPRDAGLVPDVHVDRLHAGRRELAAVLGAPHRPEHGVAASGEIPRDRFADPARRSGDDDAAVHRPTLRHPRRSPAAQSAAAYLRGTKIETRGSGPTSRVAWPCPVRSSAIRMSPEPSRRTVPSPISMST